MAKISNTNIYPTKASPSSTDYVIGTDASSKETKTFTLQSIANLYSGTGAGSVTSVGLDGGTTGIIITSDTTNPITTTGTFTLGGTLTVANGGTGITSLGTRSQSLRVNAAADGLEYTDSNVVEIVRNNTSSTILKGQPLKVVGEVAGVVSVETAQANSSANMPCIGLAAEDIPATSNGLMIQVGMLKSININTIAGTGAAAVGDVVYVAGALLPGSLLLTRNKPNGVDLIQNVGIITKTGANGDIQVTAIGRTNDLPNLPEGSIWLGDSNGAPSALSIGTSNYVLTSNGTTASWAQNGGNSVSLGFSPSSVYEADDITNASYTYYTMLVCDVDFTLSYIKVFVNSGSSPIYAALYSTTTGDMQTSSFTRLASFTKLTGVSNGINEIIIDDSPVSLTAGQNLMLAFSTDNVMVCGSGVSSNLLNVQEVSLSTSFPANLASIENTNPSRKRVSIHFYAS